MERPVKKDGLEIHQVDSQFVIYEAGSDVVHYLNPTAALVLDFCDGGHDAAAIAAGVQEAYGLPAPPLKEVCDCLATLQTLKLVS